MKLLITLIFFILTACATTSSVPRQEKTLPDGKVKFCFIGDMGLDNRVQKRVTDVLAKEDCHSIHMVGDLVYPNGILSVDDPQLEKRFTNYYKDIPAPLNLVLGNHDHKGNPMAWIELALKDPHVVFPNNYYLQNWGGLCLIHLDSNYYIALKDFIRAQKQNGWIASQTDYMKQNCVKTVALNHHPYLSRGPNHGNATGYMKDFFESYIVGKFDYHVSGHEHILSDEGERSGTRFLISGAGGNYTKGEDAGFLVFELEVEKGKMKNLNYSFRRVSSK